MKIAYFDLISGASGDMLLGALLDAGLAEDNLRKGLAKINLKDFDLRVKKVSKNGFSATKVDVIIEDDVPERHLSDIEAIIKESQLSSQIQKQALAIFHKLGKVEANIHGVSIEKVHLHELGGVDTIVDVVGVLLGLNILGVEKVFTSPVPLGRGFVNGAHGNIPLPAPATVALLQGVPITGSELETELVTPTGAVLLTSLTESFGLIPSMTLEMVGYGAGGRDLPLPNLVRLFIGEKKENPLGDFGTLVVMETNIDDLNPEIFDFIMEELFEAGALDVFLSPIQMKKNRPATLLQVLAKPDDSTKLRNILFRETTTLGVRQKLVQRFALDREIREVETPYGVVRIKIAHLDKGKIKISPEYDDCRRLAKDQGIPIQEVYKAAEFAGSLDR